MDRFANMKPDDHRPALGGWDPGQHDYWGTCRDCKGEFAGAKRCTQCADCAYAVPEPTMTIQEKLDKAITDHMENFRDLKAAGFKHFRTRVSEDGNRLVTEASVEPFPPDEADPLPLLPYYSRPGEFK